MWSCLSRVLSFLRSTKIFKVGSSTSRELDIVRRLKTIALASEASESPAHGLFVSLNKYEALFAVIGTREGSRQILETIAPLSDAVVFVKRAIRCVFFVPIQRRSLFSDVVTLSCVPASVDY